MRRELKLPDILVLTSAAAGQILRGVPNLPQSAALGGRNVRQYR